MPRRGVLRWLFPVTCPLSPIFRGLLPILFLAICPAVFAQTTSATLTGFVTDQSRAIMPGVKVEVINVDTGVHYSSVTNNAGSYMVPNLPPGDYEIEVQKQGFKTILRPGIVLQVQQAAAINFTMAVGSINESVTVSGGTPFVDTQDGTVSTVVDRQLVQNIPLNGRSFQTLLELTPGVVLTPAAEFGDQGQFSVNGQRADTNYFTVDGVSANFGVSAYPLLGQNGGGTLPALTAQGGTNSLVSVDAMQEFRVQTSTFAPEYGSTPGAQVSIVTRSGTNQFHGDAYDYLRNDVLDANDWFSDRNGLPKPEERQNDFGGVLGGPIIVPGLYSGRDRTFFFFSYEGLRLRQPKTEETIVPDTATRQASPAAVQPFLNAFPKPNGPELGNGFAQFNGSYSDPSTLNATSIRIDQVISPRVSIFGRYDYSPSDTFQRAWNGAGSVLSSVDETPFAIYTATLGLTAAIAPNLNDEFRLNYSHARATDKYVMDNFGGAVPPPLPAGFSGYSQANSEFTINFYNQGLFYGEGSAGTDSQRQWDLVDNISVSIGRHQSKFGVDYRALSPSSGSSEYYQDIAFSGASGVGGATSGNAAFVYISSGPPTAFIVRNFSLFAQDTWTITPRLTATYGLRWDVNPAVRGANATSVPYTVNGLSNPATMTLAPRGTPIYQTTYGNVAPRFGVAYLLRRSAGWGTVLRGGVGTFYDLGSGDLAGNVGSVWPFSSSKFLYNAPLPLSASDAAPAPLSTSPPVNELFVAEPHLALPRTYQWNLTLEQSLGADQSLSASYVGAIGRKLLRETALYNPNPDFGFVGVTNNSASSNYNALQLKFNRRLSKGLQALASYTWSHSIDIASTDVLDYTSTPGVIANANIDRGPSDFDIRSSTTGAVTYDLPGGRLTGIAGALAHGWSTDAFLTARSAPPVDLIGAYSFVGGTLYQARPDVVPGQPLYLFGSDYPGGKAFNPAAFVPPAGPQGDLPRNVLRGFGAWQLDFAIARQFHLGEKLALHFRAEFFNIFNHPNFGSPDSTITDPLFGQSTGTLADSLGSGGANGGFNPLYQIGGPRSVQLALKLMF